jgi:hypothetical protein
VGGLAGLGRVVHIFPDFLHLSRFHLIHCLLAISLKPTNPKQSEKKREQKREWKRESEREKERKKRKEKKNNSNESNLSV